MASVQSLENKRGEIEFRKNLALQFENKKIFYPSEPSAEEFSQIIKDRVRGYKTYFRSLFKKNAIVGPYLELGAGVGQAAMLLENTYHGKGFISDISFETLALAPQFKKKLHFTKMPIRICCDAYNLPFKSQSLPFVFCFQTLHHFPDPTPILREVKRVLTPGGYFYFNEEPIAQSYNLNLWRRGTHLRWFEKILKVFIILHFISRIGKSEVEHNILEETFSLSVWKNALHIFPHVTATLSVFPFGPRIERTKNDKNNWLIPIFPYNIFLYLLGGNIEGLCHTEKEKIQTTRLFNLLEILACPNCKNRPQLSFNQKKELLSCSKCKEIYSKKKGIFLLLPKEKQNKLYPSLTDDIN